MDSKENAILKAVEAFSDDMVDLTSRLVAEPSTLQNEASVNKVMEDALVGLGYDPVRVPIDPDRLANHPGFAPVPWEYDKTSGRHNLAAVIKGTDSNAKSVLFNGHLDVAPETPLDYWNSDPFAPFVKEGWLYGRGAGDMKAGVAAMVYAAKAVERAGFALKGDLTLQTVIEEECSGNGALACLDAGYDADAVLIPEPFNLTILTQEVGVLWFRVDVSGVASHVLDTQAGSNAVEKMYPIIHALRELEKEMNAQPHPAGFEHIANPLNMNIGIMKGGFWPSTVPSSAELHCRMGFYPDESYESACERIVECVRKASCGRSVVGRQSAQGQFLRFPFQGAQHRSAASGAADRPRRPYRADRFGPCRLQLHLHHGPAGFLLLRQSPWNLLRPCGGTYPRSQ